MNEIQKFQLIERLRQHTVEQNGCWCWTGRKSSKGYGKIVVNHKELRAHRVSYEVYVCEIPSGMMVCHRCDNPCCTNPDHLFLGTARDNSVDRVQKGRFSPDRDLVGRFLKT